MFAPKRRLLLLSFLLQYLFVQQCISQSLEYDATGLNVPGHSQPALVSEQYVTSSLLDSGDKILEALVHRSQRSRHFLNYLRSIHDEFELEYSLDESIGESLSEEDVEFIGDLLEIDARNGNILRTFRQHNSLAKFSSLSENFTIADESDHRRQSSLDPELLFQLAEIAPIFSKSKQCQEQSKTFLTQLVLRKQWAIKLLDFSGKIPDGVFLTSTENMIPFGNHAAIGAYGSCLDLTEEVSTLKGNITVTGRHSMIKMFAKVEDKLEEALSSNEDVKTGLPDKVKLELINAANFEWGICSPSACTSQDISDSLNVLLSKVKMINQFLGKNIKLATAPIFQTSQGDTAESVQPKFGADQAGSIGFICVLALLAAVMLLGTVADVYQRFHAEEEANIAQPVWLRVLKCFSIYTNGKKVLDSRAGGSDHLGCLGGIRTISMMWVILCHSYLGAFSNVNTIMNRSVLLKAFGFIGKRDSKLFMVIVNGFPSVDTFFLLSGLLVAYISFAALEKKRFNIFVYYIHRYIRLTIPLAFAIGFVAFISPYLAKGPFAELFTNAGPQNCRDHWYLNLLYMNNFFNEDKMCLTVTWYLACDMQMYWYAPLIILPIWWNEKIGLVFWGLNMAAFTCVQGYLTAHYHLGPSIIIQHEKLHGFNSDFDYYNRVYTRMQPYLIGLLLGYILFKTKGKTVRIPPVMNLIFWIVSLGLGWLVVLGIYPLYRYEYSLVQTTIYSSFFRIPWSIALSYVIFSCIKGYGGVVDKFLSWGAFTVLSRLTYFTYLIHLDILCLIFASVSFTMEMNDYQVILHFFAVLVIAMSCAFVATICFESPFIGIEKIVMGALLGSPRAKPQGTQPPVQLVESDNAAAPHETGSEDTTSTASHPSSIAKAINPPTPPPTFEESQASVFAAAHHGASEKGMVQDFKTAPPASLVDHSASE